MRRNDNEVRRSIYCYQTSEGAAGRGSNAFPHFESSVAPGGANGPLRVISGSRYSSGGIVSVQSALASLTAAHLTKTAVLACDYRKGKFAGDIPKWDPATPALCAASSPRLRSG